jgi:hypothetical protein
MLRDKIILYSFIPASLIRKHKAQTPIFFLNIPFQFSFVHSLLGYLFYPFRLQDPSVGLPVSEKTVCYISTKKKI